MKEDNALKCLIFSIFILVMTACSTTTGDSPVPNQFSRHIGPSPAIEYHIQPGDQLAVKFFYHPDFNTQVTVRPDGRISLQLAGELMAAGKTPQGLSEEVAERYEKELRNPEATVIVQSFSAHKVYVNGEVRNPNAFQLVGPITVLQAISQAGGFTDTAEISNIVVLRKTSGLQYETYVVDAVAILNGTDPNQDMQLFSDDMIHVPRSKIANVNLWVDQYLRKNIPIPLYIPLD